MQYRVMAVEDIDLVVPMYIEYYNEVDGSQWTRETVYKRIHQILTREDAYCFLAEQGSETVGFVMGYLEQFDDIAAYCLSEIVVAMRFQKQGVGTEMMLELEHRVQPLGAAMIQLQAENDDMHAHFYIDKLHYQKANSFVSMTKWL